MLCFATSDCAATHKVPFSFELILFHLLMFRDLATTFAVDSEGKTSLVIAAADLAAELGTAAGA